MPSSFEIDDLFQYQRLMSVECSPAGDRVACALETVLRESNAYACAIWLYPTRLGESQPIKLTAGTALDTSPSWSPDGKQIAFLSSRSGGAPQVFLIDCDGGEARQLAWFAQGVVSVSWSPDGSKLLIAANVPLKEKDYTGQSGPFEEEGPEVVWQLPYKSDVMGYTLRQRVHLFTLDPITGQTFQLTSGAFNAQTAQWAGDGQTIVHTRTQLSRAAHKTDIWTMNADGSDARQLSHDVGTAASPSVSPDGRWVAFIGGADEGDARLRLWLIDRQKPGEWQPCQRLELAPECSINWAGDSQSLYLIAAHRGMQEVGRVTVPDGEYQTIAGGETHVRGLSSSGSRLVWMEESLRQPNQLFACDPDGSNRLQLSWLNAWWQDRIQPQVQLRRFELPNGTGGVEPVEGWLLRPPGATTPGPLLVDVHGGPCSYALLAYPSHIYWNVLVSRGWSVLALNPVGSSSYDQEFGDRLRGRWGELDLPQHLAAVDALQSEGVADERIAITGKSYGGYLTAWALGKTDRFRVAVVSAPIINLEAHYGNSDSGYYADPYDMLGEPSDQRDTYRRLSPLPYLPSARTPTLILQGKDDLRCPAGQAEELFVAMMRCSKVPVEMVLYPGGNHHFFESGMPSFRADVAGRLVRWMERYIADPAVQEGP